MADLVVLADDRTGALETAGTIADAGWGSVPVVVAPHPIAADASVYVVDIGSRHITAVDAATRAVDAVGTVAARRHAHKIDSTLRGNWAHEVVARQAATGWRVLVVPAFPAVGRTCDGGVVHVDGVPLTNRPADLLIGAGATAVATLRGAHDVASWASYGSSPRIAVCDATTTADLAAIGRAWAQLDDVLLAGSAGAVGAGASALVVEPVGSVVPPLVPPVLVVCGSLHAVARAQIEALGVDAAATMATVGDDTTALVAALRSGVIGALSTPFVPSPTAGDAERAAAELAQVVRTLTGLIEIGTLVIVGGDTAAAVLGDRPLCVGGTLGPGIPWARHPAATGGPLVVTKAGGFGDDHTLVRLVTGRMEG